MSRILVTGGAGFIGSALVRMVLQQETDEVLVVDNLTYAGNLDSLADAFHNPRFRFVRADIVDTDRMRLLVHDYRPNIIMHLAAESHVDRSIDGPGDFIQTNVVGTFSLLQAALGFWRSLSAGDARAFRFHHVSTDEVFGSLGPEGRFTETTAYAPNSPYSASKAASDHLARAWCHTYGLPVVVSNSSNNYGPYQFPEKLVPLTILNALEGLPLPVYGDGSNIRDWLYVGDHVRALLRVATRGRPGESYNVGGNTERTNLDVVRAVCELVDELAPDPVLRPRSDRITFVENRPGHDLRYAIDGSKTDRELGWKPEETFESGLGKTVRWYLENRSWWTRVRTGVYRGQRLGKAV